LQAPKQVTLVSPHRAPVSALGNPPHVLHTPRVRGPVSSRLTAEQSKRSPLKPHVCHALGQSPPSPPSTTLSYSLSCLGIVSLQSPLDSPRAPGDLNFQSGVIRAGATQTHPLLARNLLRYRGMCRIISWPIFKPRLWPWNIAAPLCPCQRGRQFEVAQGRQI